MYASSLTMPWLADIDQQLLAISQIVLALVAIYYWLQKQYLQNDLKRLDESIRKISRKESAPQRLKFFNDITHSIWQTALQLFSRMREAERARESIKNLSTLSQQISEVSDDTINTAEQLIDIIFTKVGRDVRAVAVALLNDRTQAFEISCIKGIPRIRIEEVLSIYFDSLTTSNTALNKGWGYYWPSKGSVFDLSTFNVGQFLTVPIQDNNGICGALWIGFDQSSTSFGTTSKDFVQSLAGQAAAAFRAARRFEERWQKSDDEKNYLLGLSHDLRSPGNSALYAVRDLLSGEVGELSEVQNARLEIVEQALLEQQDLLTDVFDLEKHQRGFLNANKKPFALAKFVEALTQLYASRASQKGLSLKVDPAPLDLIFADEKHAQRILANMISNAIKYSSVGTIEISYRQNNSHLEILVADNGVGIDEQERKDLFKPFQRLKSGQAQQGVGLGLAMSKALAEINGGYIFYLPNATGGSIFGLGLPLNIAATTQCKSELNSILVIDDDPAVTRMNSRFLSEICTTVLTAISISEAIGIIKRNKPDFIVADINVGTESIKDLLNYLEHEHIAIPKILLSGIADKNILTQLSYEYGLICMEKPVAREQLLNAIAGELERQYPHYLKAV